MANRKTLLNKINKLKAEYQRLLRPSFDEALAKFFADNPGIDSFSFYGYTPSWNDGEPCRFSCNYDEPTINEINPVDEEFNKELCNYQNLVFDFLKQFSDEDYENMFTDNFTITFYRDGRVIKHDCNYT